ncbi:MAG: tRNA (adenosine(37)-N6)-threonylcarbamoyltransferase complex dimerization subunit type 1 TsaB [Alphaproteobacteria bacterium CG_4_10_14_0_8_um_filter_53_9]|nr:MAG: tRNA (adenosine(37)-N6)-threonylcarbamoyltransferase complex dimerization subunit type 1 TsaB [Alphaproteobacteria bacterium CG_4_10_14_0_8_um_filter_53_9]
MLTLILDTTLNGLTLALAKGDEIVARYTTAAPRSATTMHPHLVLLLEEVDAAASDISKVVLTVGPGSFTGIRLGIAVADALQLVRPDVEIVGTGTLGVMGLWGYGMMGKEITTWGNAFGGQVFVGRFGADGAPLGKVACMPLAEAEATLHDGDVLVAGMGIITNARVDVWVDVLPPEAILDAARLYPLPPLPLYIKDLGYRKVGEA